MERILVSMNEGHGAWEAWSRAISLAKRIDARIFVLLVSSKGIGDRREAVIGHDRGSLCPGSVVREKLELLIQSAKSEKVRVDYFTTEGAYEEEVLRFIDQNRITLLVAEHQPKGAHNQNGPSAFIRRLKHQSPCRVEVVRLRRQPDSLNIER